MHKLSPQQQKEVIAAWEAHRQSQHIRYRSCHRFSRFVKHYFATKRQYQ